MEEKKLPSEILGYYIAIFQSCFNGYIKCWFDGNPNYKLMSESSFLNLFEQINANYEFICDVKDYITTSSIYIWDITNSKIQKLNSIQEEDSLRNYVTNSFKSISNKSSIREIRYC